MSCRCVMLPDLVLVVTREDLERVEQGGTWVEAAQPVVRWVGEPIELGSEQDHSLGAASMRARMERIKREMGR